MRLTAFSHGGSCGCKIAPGVLSELLRGPGARLAEGGVPPALLVGPETADDAAVYRLDGERAIVATTDFFLPIVDDPYEFGRIGAANALSDVYAMGGAPMLALVAMPVERLPLEAIRRVLGGGEAVCREAGVPVAGGHTIDSIEPIYGLAALGLVHPERVMRNSGARAGDLLVLGKRLGVGVYAAALRKERLDADASRELIAVATKLNSAGPRLAQLAGVHAMTDVTGFGLLGHLLEVCRGSRLGAEISACRVPLLPEVTALVREGHVTCASARNWASYGGEVALDGVSETERTLLTDPQTSGGLLVACAEDALADAPLRTAAAPRA